MNPESVTNIFQQMRHKLWMLGNALLKNADDVNDAMQDAFCRIWNNRDNIDDGDNPKGLVLTTMRNVCIDNIRSRAYAANISLECVPDEDIEEEQAESGTDDDMYADVISIMQRELTAAQCRIMHMRDVEGRSYADIANEMGMEEATVRVNLSRARKTVRNIYRNRYE